MTAEQEFLIQCLADMCSGRKTNASSDNRYTVDYDELYRIAEEQGLDGLMFGQCRQMLAMHPSFRKSFLGHVFLSVNRADILKEIIERFASEGISLICMKGSVFRDSYPVPELRSMGDIDFIIHSEDREKADRIMMEEMGFERLIDNHSVWTYWTGHFMFEIHDHMFYEYLANRVDYRTYFDSVWESAHHGKVFKVEADNLYVPDENLHFLYLMAHTAKHIINSGSGFRAFLDMVMLSRDPDFRLDWEWIEHELEELELLEFTRNCFAFCERWFGVKMPLDTAEISDEFFERVTEKIFNDGIFGLDNEENTEAKSAKSISRSKAPYGIAAIKYAVSQMFPPYRNMQLIPWYSWVDGKPWLLPAAWIYRWGYCLIHKGERSRTVISEPFMKKDRVEKREQQIREWGL